MNCYCFNNLMTFNLKHEFNQSFGRNKSSFNPRMESKLKAFIERLKELDCKFLSIDFGMLDLETLDKDSFIYVDLPYSIADSGYNRGSKDAGILKGWFKEDDLRLFKFLDEVNKKGLKFGMSNVSIRKGKENRELINYVNNRGYNLHYLDYDYTNCHYRYKDIGKKSSVEVYVCNY